MIPAHGWRFGLMCLLWATAGGVAAESQLPPSPEPALPTIAELAALPDFSGPELSRSGNLLAGFSQKGDRQVVVVLGATVEFEPFVVSAPDWRINWFRWLADDRLLVSLSVPRNFSGTPVTVRRLVLADPKARTLDLLLKKEDGPGARQVQDRLISTLPDDPDHILLDINPDSASKAQARRVALKPNRRAGKIVQRALPQVNAMRADAQGNVRVGWGIARDNKSEVLRLRAGNGEWTDHSERFNTSDFKVLGLPTSNLDLLYVSSDHEYPLGALYEYDVQRGEFGKLLAQHDNSEIAGVDLDPEGRTLTTVYFSSEAVPTLYLDPALKALDAQLDDFLPETTNSIVSHTQDLAYALIRASASDQAPFYLLFDRDARRLIAFSAGYRSLSKRRLAVTKIHRYPARDGLEIQAYVTLPAAAQPDQPVPFVVLPHGGPHSRDFLRFDWLTQLIASQGYGVLQMNFRGSSGYGQAFEDAGERQWGQAMQDDVTDGTRWLVQQGLADPDRIAIAGASYGGYAALMGVVREPALYRCAISLNGVSDLPMLLTGERRYIGGAYGTRHIGRLWRDRKSLRENSPARQAARIAVPVLLVHGDKDRIVDVRQSRRMRRNLKAASVTHQYLELPEGDHYLSIPSNRLAFAETAIEFLNRHMSKVK